MKKIISFRRAIQLSLLLFGVFTVFHLSILMGIIFFDYTPVEFLWGGQFQTREELLVFEVISLFIMILCNLTVLIRSKILKFPKLFRASKIGIWILFILFLMSTVGNLLAKSTFEKYFAIFTIILAFLCLRMALEKDNSTSHDQK